MLCCPSSSGIGRTRQIAEGSRGAEMMRLEDRSDRCRRCSTAGVPRGTQCLPPGDRARTVGSRADRQGRNMGGGAGRRRQGGREEAGCTGTPSVRTRLRTTIKREEREAERVLEVHIKGVKERQISKVTRVIELPGTEGGAKRGGYRASKKARGKGGKVLASDESQPSARDGQEQAIDQVVDAEAVLHAEHRRTLLGTGDGNLEGKNDTAMLACRR